MSKTIDEILAGVALDDKDKDLIIKYYEEEGNNEEKIEERFKYNLLCESNQKGYKENRALVHNLCKEDFKFFANNFIWIQDPRAEETSKETMFLLYPFQEFAADEIVKNIKLGKDIPIEKSRDMGLSWLLMAIFVWGWHFHGWDLLVGSQKFENVDKVGNIKSLLPKARYIIERMPLWMRPELKFRVHDKTGVLIHPKNGATLAGESNNVNFGRSDRRKAILLDEFSSWTLSDKQAWQSCGAATSCRIPLSTPNYRGVNCYFYQVLKNAKAKDLPYLRLHWSLNPTFNRGLYVDDLGSVRSPWYDNQEERAVDVQREVRQELDIDYEASMSGKVFPAFKVEEQVSDNIRYNPSLPVYYGWDFGLDSTAIIVAQIDKQANKIYIIDEYQNDGTTREGSDIMHYIDVISAKDYKKGIHFGDPQSGENRSLAARGESNARILRRNGLIFKCKRTKIRNRVAAARNIVPKIMVSSDCSLFIECLTSWQMVQPKTGNRTGEVPQHNEYSHIGEAFTYLAWMLKVNEQKYSQPKEKPSYELSLGGVVM